MSFTDFILHPDNIIWFKKRHVLKTYAYDTDGCCLADFVFPMDKKNNFHSFMIKNCNLKLGHLPFLNKTSKPPELLEEVRDCYNNKVILTMIYEIFQEDIRRFGYSNPFLFTKIESLKHNLNKLFNHYSQ